MRLAFFLLLAACAAQAPERKLDATGKECESDSECVITKYNRRIKGPDRCVCLAQCGDSLPKKLAKEYEKQWDEHCSDAKLSCPEVECRKKVPAVCDHGRCMLGAPR